jgi:uncharacterized membrane protein
VAEISSSLYKLLLILKTKELKGFIIKHVSYFNFTRFSDSLENATRAVSRTFASAARGSGRSGFSGGSSGGGRGGGGGGAW